MKPTPERVPSRIALTIAGAAWCSMTCAAHAEPAPPAATPTPALQLEPIVVKGQALRSARLPYSVSAFTTEEIRAQQASHPQELLRWVPGMHVRSLGLGGVADPVVLRGFASGAPAATSASSSTASRSTRRCRTAMATPTSAC